MKRPVAYIAGTGRGVPAKILKNDDFAALGLETNDEWIASRTGIRERRIAGEGETTCSMAAAAAKAAMERAGVHAGELDAIVLSTATTDRLLPSTAVDLQAMLGASRAVRRLERHAGRGCAGRRDAERANARRQRRRDLPDRRQRRHRRAREVAHRHCTVAYVSLRDS